MTTPKNKDCSMLYAVIAGAALFALPILLLLFFGLFSGEREYTGIYVPYHMVLETVAFPENAVLLESEDTHGGFHGDGMTILVVEIPASDEESFLAQLRDKGFSSLPADETAQNFQCLDEMSAPLQAENGLYRFYNDSPEYANYISNFTFELYDSDANLYYYVEEDT